MDKKITIVALMLLVLSIPFVTVFGQSDTEAHIEELEEAIKTLILKENDYAGALRLYAQAARSDPQESYYREQFALLRRVIQLRQSLDDEPNVEKWMSLYQPIRAYYYSKGYYTNALESDLAAVEKNESIDTVSNALETLLMIGNNTEAADMMKAKPVPRANQTMRYQTLAALVDARTENIDQARSAIEAIDLTGVIAPMIYFDTARIYWLAEQSDRAMQRLITMLENTPPSELPIARRMIVNSLEFSSLHGNDEFEVVLATASKIPQSSCTGGSSCNTCSLRTNCASGQ